MHLFTHESTFPNPSAYASTQVLRKMKHECCLVQPTAITSPRGRKLLQVSDWPRVMHLPVSAIEGVHWAMIGEVITMCIRDKKKVALKSNSRTCRRHTCYLCCGGYSTSASCAKTIMPRCVTNVHAINPSLTVQSFTPFCSTSIANRCP